MPAIEVITSVERRRRWSREEKLRIVAESARPYRMVSQVARAHGIAPGQLFSWRRQLLAAAIESRGSDCGFVPVIVASQAAAQAAATDVDRAIEIRLASGIVIRVGREVEIEPLQRVLRALGQ
jgi:transposase